MDEKNSARGYCWELEPKMEEDGALEQPIALSKGLHLPPRRNYWECY